MFCEFAKLELRRFCAVFGAKGKKLDNLGVANRRTVLIEQAAIG